MLVLIRLMLAFFICCYVNYIADIRYFENRPDLTSFAMSAMFSGVSLIFFFYGKWFCFISKRTNGQKNGLFVFENIILPVLFMVVFVLAFFGLDIFCSENSWVLVGALILYDKNEMVSKFLWKNRFYEFSGYPENGVVQESVLRKNKWLIISFFVFIPLAGYMVKPFYS